MTFYEAACPALDMLVLSQERLCCPRQLSCSALSEVLGIGQLQGS